VAVANKISPAAAYRAVATYLVITWRPGELVSYGVKRPITTRKLTKLGEAHTVGNGEMKNISGPVRTNAFRCPG